MDDEAAGEQHGDDGSDLTARVIEATLGLIAERGVDGVSLSEVADQAGIGLAVLHRRFGSKQAILRAFTRHIDAIVLAGRDNELPDPEETARDRLFDVLMHRFDALRPYKSAIRRMVGDSRRRPAGMIGHAGSLAGSMAWMLEAAGIDSNGALGEMRKLALAGAYVVTLREWLRDDSPDLARTMATLDRQLRRLESLTRRWPGPFRRGRPPWSRSGDGAVRSGLGQDQTGSMGPGTEGQDATAP